MEGIAKMPAANHLSLVNDGCATLEEEKAQLFHHLLAMLYLCKWARQDIQTAVAFLCTRVKSLSTDEYKELTIIMQYLCGTQD